MLVATRDPFHDGEQKAPGRHQEPREPHGPKRPPGERFMGLLQMTGALLAIPIGLFTAYSLYRANFSVETTCQSLRAGIIATLDKSVDASARRMLVRRDVQTFEQTCAEIDPDATAAFKSLLAVDKATAAAPSAAKPPAVVRKDVPKVEAKAESKVEPKAEAKPEPKVEAKSETRPEPKADTAAKPAVAAPVAAAAPVTTPAPAAESDANWLAAVRGALEEHPAQPAAAVVPATAVQMGAPPAKLAVPATARPAVPADNAALNAPPPAPHVAEPVAATAPALPPATDVPGTTAAAPAASKSNHPVPPGSIPHVTENVEPEVAPDSRSRLGQLIGGIPLLGPVIAPKRD